MNNKILIIDSDNKCWLGLKEFLTNKQFTIHQVDTRDDAFSILDRGECFVVLLELALPEQGGALLMEEIYQVYPRIPIAIITEQESMDAAIRAVRCNVLDYVFKPVENAVLQHLVYKAYGKYVFQKDKEKIYRDLGVAIESLRYMYGLSRPSLYQREEAELTDEAVVDLERGVLIKENSETLLTPIERSLLSNFLENPGRVFTIDEVWHNLYGEYPEKGKDPRDLIRTNVHRLRKKLKTINEEKDWVLSVRGEGYTFEP